MKHKETRARRSYAMQRIALRVIAMQTLRRRNQLVEVRDTDD